MRFQGNPVSAGVAVAPVLIYRPELPKVEERFVPKEQVEGEREKYRIAAEGLSLELRQLVDPVGAKEQMKIFEAHAEILADPVLPESIFALIDGGMCAEWAVSTVFGQLSQVMRESGNAVMMERAADFEDLRQKLLCLMIGVQRIDLSALDIPCIIAAEDLLPSDVASFPTDRVNGVVLERGGATSHAAILARSKGIPMLMDVADCTAFVEEGETVVLDALDGVLVTKPTVEDLTLYKRLSESWKGERDALAESRGIPAGTRDGARVRLLLNVAGEVPGPGVRDACDGVGLLRSEFFFLSRSAPPGEEEQFSHYRAVLEAMDGKPVVLRTLDAGGDKPLPYLHEESEPNPLLGRRGLRLCLEHKVLFRTQLRAALRASVFGPLRLMFPMVGNIEEFLWAKGEVERVKNELDLEGTAFNRDLPLGVMIEVPALALMGRELVRIVDFASVGTNDLCQYLNAADRTNPQVEAYYAPCHPSMLRLIGSLASLFEEAGKPLSICGEAVGDMDFLLICYGLGISSFSMELSNIAKAKRALACHSGEELRRIASCLLSLGTVEEIKTYLHENIKIE